MVRSENPGNDGDSLNKYVKSSNITSFTLFLFVSALFPVNTYKYYYKNYGVLYAYGHPSVLLSRALSNPTSLTVAEFAC